MLLLCCNLISLELSISVNFLIIQKKKLLSLNLEHKILVELNLHLLMSPYSSVSSTCAQVYSSFFSLRLNAFSQASPLPFRKKTGKSAMQVSVLSASHSQDVGGSQVEIHFNYVKISLHLWTSLGNSKHTEAIPSIQHQKCYLVFCDITNIIYCASCRMRYSGIQWLN